jgi:hypothetical protein
LALATQQQLVSLGVVLKMGRRVTEITKEGITTSDGEFIEAELKYGRQALRRRIG